MLRSSNSFDAVVLGAGVIGVSSAYWLARAGKLEVQPLSAEGRDGHVGVLSPRPRNKTGDNLAATVKCIRVSNRLSYVKAVPWENWSMEKRSSRLVTFIAAIFAAATSVQAQNAYPTRSIK